MPIRDGAAGLVLIVCDCLSFPTFLMGKVKMSSLDGRGYAQRYAIDADMHAPRALIPVLLAVICFFEASAKCS